MKLKYLPFLLLALFSLANAVSVKEDSERIFAFSDKVLDSGIYECVDDKGAPSNGYRFLPEDVRYKNDNAMPYRIYKVALPKNSKPSVSIANVKLKKLSIEKKSVSFCEGEKIKSTGISVSAPYLKDGLWISEIEVPLFDVKGSSIALKESFDIRVEFATASVGGVSPGNRALSRVLNKKSAARFGVKNTEQNRRNLRRAAAADISDINFLAEILIGDKNIATMQEDGLYALDYKTIKKAMNIYGNGTDLDGIPIEKLRVYGAASDSLSSVVPESQILKPNQLFEIPIEVRDHSGAQANANGIFDDGDTLLFIGYGTGFWKRNDSENFPLDGTMDYYHSYSPYSFYQHFLLGWSSSGKGMRLNERLKTPSGTPQKIKWKRYVRAEKEMLLRDTYYGKDIEWESSTGKEWFWIWHSRFDSTEIAQSELTQDQVENLKGLVEGGAQYAAVSYFPFRSVWSPNAVLPNDQIADLNLSGESYESRMKGIRFNLNVNGEIFNSENATLLPGGNFKIDNIKLKKSNNKFSLTLRPNVQQYDRFDGYSFAYEWIPEVDSSEWLLPGISSGIIEIPAPNGVQVVKFKKGELVGILPSSSGRAIDSIAKEDDVRYLLYRENIKLTPFDVVGIPPKNQNVLSNLAKINSRTEYLIIAPDEFLEPAVTLGTFRSDGSAVATFATTVVSVNDIFRMYKGGTLSPVAIRNYIAYAYSVCPQLKYVLLAGLGNFDYRRFNEKLGKNFIPPYELEDNATDDFYAVLDEGEFVRYGKYDIDIAVGRLPVSNVVEFANYIQKAKEYEKLGEYDNGSWRRTLLLSADDAKNNFQEDRSKHTVLQEGIANALDSLKFGSGFALDMKKIYLLNYPEDAAGQKKDAAEDFINALNQGALMTTYFGHGSKTDWASEGLLKPSYLSKIHNEKKYTILNSFSCTVGRFDEGKTKTLSEEFVLAVSSGSIASLGAVRETFATYNVEFGKSFMIKALSEPGVTLGESIFKIKDKASSEFSRQRYNNEHYVLLGEPIIRMPSPTLKIKIDTPFDTIKALDKMKISGSVSGMNDGYIELSLREGRANKRLALLVDDDTLDVSYNGTLLYSEHLPVVSGRFETEFITPRKMNFGDTTAEFSAWAYSTQEKHSGSFFVDGLKIAGFSNYKDSLNDTIAPLIQIRSCNNLGKEGAFADQQKVKLLAPACLHIEVEDSTALDFREQADEGISIEVGGVEDPYHPASYMEQNSKRAVFRKTFATESYPEGSYFVKVKAYDVLGNEAEKSVIVEVSDQMKEGLVDVFNIPNPMGKKGTVFYFKNLAVDRESSVNIFIYNQHGRLVRVLKNAISGITHWDGRDNHGRLLANGLYHYVVRSTVKLNSQEKNWSKKQKLIISR